MFNLAEYIKNVLKEREYKGRLKKYLLSEKQNTPCRQQRRRIERYKSKLRKELRIA